MTMWDTALRTAETLGLRDRTPYERARASYNDLTSQADMLRSYLPTRDTVDWTSLTVGLIVGTAIGFGLGLYLKESMTPALDTARERVRKAASKVQEQIPTRLNVTRMDEQKAPVAEGQQKPL